MSNTHDTAEQLLQQAQQKSQQGQYQESIGLILKARRIFHDLSEDAYEADSLSLLVYTYNRFLRDFPNAYIYAQELEKMLPNWKEIRNNEVFRDVAANYDLVFNTNVNYQLTIRKNYDATMREAKKYLEFNIFIFGENSVQVVRNCFIISIVFRQRRLPYCEKALLKKAKSIIEQINDATEVLPDINNRINEIGTTLFAPKDDDFRQIKAMFKNF